MLTVSTFILLHEKNNLASQFFVIISYYRFTYEIRQALVRASTRGAYNLYSVTFLNYRFHTIGKYVQNYRYRLSTDMANIGPIPIPIIGQSLSSSLSKVVDMQLVPNFFQQLGASSANTTCQQLVNRLVTTCLHVCNNVRVLYACIPRYIFSVFIT